MITSYQSECLVWSRWWFWNKNFNRNRVHFHPLVTRSGGIPDGNFSLFDWSLRRYKRIRDERVNEAIKVRRVPHSSVCLYYPELHMPIKEQLNDAGIV